MIDSPSQGFLYLREYDGKTLYYHEFNFKLKKNGEKTSGGATGLFYEGSINN